MRSLTKFETKTLTFVDADANADVEGSKIALPKYRGDLSIKNN